MQAMKEFCPRMAVESMETEVETAVEEFGKIETAVDAEAAVLTMRRFFWCTMKKTLFLLFFLPECRIN